jgi:hypothetical protein
MKQWFEDAWWSWGCCIHSRFVDYNDNIDRCCLLLGKSTMVGIKCIMIVRNGNDLERILENDQMGMVY